MVMLSLIITIDLNFVLQVPEYVDESKMQQILLQPNMSSENFLLLPLILGTSLTFPTITNSSGHYDPVVFQQLWNHLKNSKP